MLLGEFTHTLDAKGRVFLPAKWREELAGEVVVTAGQERCLFVMTKEAFSRRAAQLEELSSDHKANRDYKRMFFSSASEEAVDRTGRMSIPAGLRRFAGLEGKEVILIGVSDRAEIWDRESWSSYKEGVEEGYAQVAEELS
ncbi:MAG TPA: division/cell wall cluster transcriptional repressor MraZ [Actinomycetota bacterium]|jgi:MraZ protein|nr:division/cell wall cluster transcriptional repressor MraZ [Actinomycetota bacterium]